MSEYVQVIGYITLGVDVFVLVAAVWCVWNNLRYLINYQYNIQDVPFRTLLGGMSVVFLLANLEAFRRHIDTFIVIKQTILTSDTVESLLYDRGYMFATGVFMLMMTIKYKCEWYKD